MSRISAQPFRSRVRMLYLNKKKAAEKNPETLRRLETQISATDRQIDRLVYELYDLSDEEIELVEGGVMGCSQRPKSLFVGRPSGQR